jgi:hypothetical protein
MQWLKCKQAETQQQTQMLGICTMYNLLAEKNVGLTHRVYTEWQLPISVVHSIIMEKFALAGGGAEGCTLTPFHSSYHHVQSRKV